MIIAAHQPNFLPNLAFFSKMAAVDLFVIITNLQFEKQEGWQRRHKIKGPNGDIWLTVPVLGSQNQLIKEVKINNQFDWRKKHKRSLQTIYAKAKGKDYLGELSEIYDKEWTRLVDLSVAAIFLLRDILEIKTPIVIDKEISGIKHNLLINVCKKYGAESYLSGVGARIYLDEVRLKELAQHGIKHQIVKKDLTAHYPYSTVHYLLTEGKDWVLGVLST